MIFNPKMECMEREEMRSLQSERLQKTVRTCYEKVPFYRKKMDARGVKPEDIQTIDDIVKLPFTTKTDLRDEYPFGLQAVPKEDIVRIHASSGTTGKPVVGTYTRNDLAMWAEGVARVMSAGGVDKSDTVQVSYGYGLFTGGLGAHDGASLLGATQLPTSAGNTEKQIMLMQDFQTTALVSTPSYAQYIGEKAKEMGVIDNINLKLGLLGSEGCTVEMRNQIEKTLGLFATDNYGMSELMGPGVSGDCKYRCGMHINEDHFYPEIINPDTEEVLERGSQGELVITTLTKEGIPMLRYRTKDITKINYEPCKCGRTFARMDKIKGRSDDMLKIRGVNVFPSQIESVLMGFDKIAPHYQLVVTRANFSDALEVKVELADGSLLENYGELEKLRGNIHHNLKTVLGIETKVSLVEHKSLERFQGKAKRIVDLRNQK